MTRSTKTKKSTWRLSSYNSFWSRSKSLTIQKFTFWRRASVFQMDTTSEAEQMTWNIDSGPTVYSAWQVFCNARSLSSTSKRFITSAAGNPLKSQALFSVRSSGLILLSSRHVQEDVAHKHGMARKFVPDPKFCSYALSAERGDETYFMKHPFYDARNAGLKTLGWSPSPLRLPLTVSKGGTTPTLSVPK